MDTKSYCRECSHARWYGEATVRGKVWRWHYSAWYGPQWVDAKGEPVKREPGEKHLVWEAFAKWLYRRGLR